MIIVYLFLTKTFLFLNTYFLLTNSYFIRVKQDTEFQSSEELGLFFPKF